VTRILIVEDEPSIALGLVDDLRLEGFAVELATDGIAGARRALTERFDLVLLDVMLPGRTGYDVLRDLRRRGVSTPVILLTARSQETEKILGLDLGADDYVTKPFSPAELRARIKAVLRRGSPDDVAVHRFGEFEADFGRFELRKAGEPLHVTPIELKLLAAFVKHRGKALRRSELKRLVWHDDAHMTDRVIDTHVANLRKKIEPDAGAPRYIMSVRGIGYRFDG
jgi:DNA-binding response OmpR family regulator